MAKLSDLNAIIGGSGGNWAYFAKNSKMISAFIRANAIKPTAIGHVSAGATPVAKAFIDLGIRGGIKVPHLHFNNKIYMLDEKQWAKFSESMIADCKNKLAKVKKVSFEEGLMLGSVLQALD